MFKVAIFGFLALFDVVAGQTCTAFLNGGTRNCCESTGQCQSSSCTVFGFANSAKSNCRTSGGNPNCPNSYCKFVSSNCTQQCYGYVACTDRSTSCYGSGELCLQSGSSSNFKICTDSPLKGGQAGCCCRCGGSLYADATCTGTAVASFNGENIDKTACSPLFSGSSYYASIASCSSTGDVSVAIFSDNLCNGTNTTIFAAVGNCTSTGITVGSNTYSYRISCYESAAAALHGSWLLAITCIVFFWALQ